MDGNAARKSLALGSTRKTSIVPTEARLARSTSGCLDEIESRDQGFHQADADACRGRLPFSFPEGDGNSPVYPEQYLRRQSIALCASRSELQPGQALRCA